MFANNSRTGSLAVMAMLLFCLYAIHTVSGEAAVEELSPAATGANTTLCLRKPLSKFAQVL